MTDEPLSSLESHFGDMPDPRVVGRCDHKLLDIVIIAICVVLCGAETWEEVEVFGETKEAWLRQLLQLPCGIPAHDTFRRVFSLLDGQAFQERFMEWVESVFQITRGQVIAIDGKTLRGSQDCANGKSALHLVSAWATANGLSLGQQKVADKSTEIGAIPALLKQWYLHGCSVTIDAMGYQSDIARQIVERKADYLLALKGNHPRLLQAVVEWFDWAQQRDFRDVPHSYHETVNKAHGRIEVRRCWALSDERAFEVLGHHDGWTKLRSLVMIQRERRFADQLQTETAYFISSLAPDAKRLLACVPSHWRIENSPHWTLDIRLHEHDSRLRVGDGAENFAILRRMALNLLRQHPAKARLKRKRFRAALDDSFLVELLTQI